MKTTLGLTKPERKIVSDVKKDGWHVMNVLPERDEPGWAFTIGLYETFRHPEVILFGLRGDTMHHLLNNVGEAVKGGRAYASEETDEDLLSGYLCAFRNVLPRWYEHTVGYARWYYEGSRFPLLQLFWPDRDGRFPWEAKCSRDVQRLQPRLFENEPKMAGAEWLVEE
jgi:hypothetical protein